MPACPICNARKGKRMCPAKRAVICSVCCGEKRLVEIRCPSDCVYLATGTRNDAQRAADDYLLHQDPQKAARWVRTLEDLGFLLLAIESTIGGLPARLVEDADLLIALECAGRTLDAEAKGIIYEDLPPSPTHQALTRELLKTVRTLLEILQKKRRELDLLAHEEGPVWGAAEAAQCLRVLAERCAYHISRKDEAGSFMTHLRRVHPPSPEADERAGAPRIVLG